MSIDQYAAALKARWRLGLFTMLSIVAAVTAVTLQMAPRYMASASVLVDMKSPDLVAGASIEGQMLSAHMANETNVMQSERVMLQAIKNLRLLDDAQYKSGRPRPRASAISPPGWRAASAATWRSSPHARAAC
jgi:uncharacterized protein involved in exopolysaccharide biosynthesis